MNDASVNWTLPLVDNPAIEEERAKTGLGLDDRRIELPQPRRGPFDKPGRRRRRDHVRPRIHDVPVQQIRARPLNMDSPKASPMFNLLDDSVIPIDSNGTRTETTLPGVFSCLIRDQVTAFPGLTAHQAQPWYQFLAQLGALALFQAGRTKAPHDADTWRDLLTAITPDCPEAAWSLVGDDPTLPACLQPATEQVEVFKHGADTADTLDILVTAKNHDRKSGQAIRSAPHHWLYALVTLQTAEGYAGKFNYGIARMNGFYSSRVLVDQRPNHRWGRRVDRAIRMLLARRADILERAGEDVYRSTGGLGLVWLRPWDTDTQIRMSELDPFFIEVCRRIRLTATADGRIAALKRTSKHARIDAAALKGNLSDPWVPINAAKGEATALTVSSTGFDYRLAQRILLDHKALKPPIALRELPHEHGLDSEIHMAVLVRGQGKTEGLHERIIPLPHSIAIRMRYDEGQEESAENSLAELSQRMVDTAAKARKVLRQAVLVYLQGPEHPNFKRADATSTLTRYDRAVDRRFFDSLFSTTEAGSNDTNRQWQQFLKEQALKLARRVWETTSPPSSRREKARAASESVLFGGLRKHLPKAHPASQETTA